MFFKGVCALNNYIYAVGGYTTNLQLASVERYDTVTNQWSYVRPMSSPRSALACVASNMKIIAIGGYNGSAFLSTIEVYDPEKDEWNIGRIGLTSERSGNKRPDHITHKRKHRSYHFSFSFSPVLLGHAAAVTVESRI